MTETLSSEIRHFRQVRLEHARIAQEMMALQLLAGIDLAQAGSLSGQGLAHLLLRLNRLIEKERQRGIRKHWSYNLDRHIALKQAFDRLNQNRSRLGANKKGSA